MWIEVDDLNLVSLGTPLPEQESMFILPSDDGLQAVSRFVSQDRICSIQLEVNPGIVVAINISDMICLDRI